MKYLELQKTIHENIFSFTDVIKMFSNENIHLIKMQLSRFSRKKLITKIKRELYCFEPEKIEEYELAPLLYRPSYISLESALNYYGVIPDIPQSVTSVSLTTTKKIRTIFGSYLYSKIDAKLYYGFTFVKSAKSPRYFYLAEKEKAILDYLHIRKITKIAGLRLNTHKINKSRYQFYAKNYPDRIKKISIW